MPERPIVYLDNAATTWPKPPEMIDAISDFLRAPAGNAGRGAHAGAAKASSILGDTRAMLARLINARDDRRVVLTSGATEGINSAIHGIIGNAVREGRAPVRVIASPFEHNAVVRPLQVHVERGEIELVRPGATPEGEVDVNELISLVNERTELVIVCAASNATGILQPIAEVGTRLREMGSGALFLVDGAQAVGASPVDVRASHIDLLAMAGHKCLLGPTGVGALYIGERVYDACEGIERMPPACQGGTGTDATNPAMPVDMPKRYEAGTRNTVGFAGLRASLVALDGKRDEILAHERAHITKLIDAFTGDERIMMAYPQNANRMGVLSFALNGADVHEVAAILDQSFGICVRAGLQCAPWAHEAVGTVDAGMIRVSPGWMTTDEEIETFISAVREVLDEV